MKSSNVTPYVGVWIETSVIGICLPSVLVTPYVGVWIETDQMAAQFGIKASHPTWVCGLKPFLAYQKVYFDCHTLRGCVD